MMNKLYRLSIEPSISLDDAWNKLEMANIEILYGSEEEGVIEIFAYVSSIHVLSTYQWIIAFEPYTLPSIDWKTQWASHSPHFQGEYLSIDFSSFQRSSPSIRLIPGSGFGDLSHPSTRLMLELLTQHCQEQIVIDIGCGSGILTLAAVALGATRAYGIDIEEDALEHSRQNATLNHFNQQCLFCLPNEFEWQPTSHPVLILMNMIMSDQQNAWNSLSQLHNQQSECLTSGIRIEEREQYLEQTEKWKWSLVNEREEMGWLAFYFINTMAFPIF